MPAVRRPAPAVRHFAALAIALAVAPLARGQVLDLVPSDAVAVVKVKNVGAVSTKAAQFFTTLGVAAFKPEFADPLGALQEKSGIKNGLNRDGDFAVAVMLPKGQQGGGNAAPPAEGAFNDTDTGHTVILAQDQQGGAAAPAPAPGGRRRGGGMGQPSPVVLIPVSDYAAFLTNFQGAQELEGGLTQVTVPNNPRPQFVAHWGNYAAVSPNKALVSQKPAGVKPSPVVAKEMDAKDIVVYVNTPELKKTVLPLLQSRRQQLIDEVKTSVARDPVASKFSNLVNQSLAHYLDLAESFLRDSNGAAFSINLNDAGINLSALSDFAAESPMGKSVAQMKPTDQPLLAGVPTGKYIFYGGFQLSPQTANALVDHWIAPSLEAFKKDNPGGAAGNGQAMTQALDAAKRASAAIKSVSFAMPAPQAAIGTESLIQGFMVIHGDAKAYTAANKQFFTAFNSVLGDANAANAAPPANNAQPDANKPADANANKLPFKASGELKENAKTVDGVTLDQFTMHFTADPSTPEGAMLQQNIATMYGPNGLNTVWGPVTDNAAVVVYGGSDPLISKAIAAAKADDTALAKQENVKAVDAQLPENRIAVGYFALDELVTTVVFYAKQFGLPANVQLPPDLPPLAGAVATEGSAARVEGTIPTQLIQSITAAVLQTMQQMQGGGAPAGANPGGL